MNLDGPSFALLLFALFAAPGASWFIWAIRCRALRQPVLKWHAHTACTVAYYAILAIIYTIVFSSPTETPATTIGCLWVLGGVLLVIWNLIAAIVVQAPDGIPRCKQCGYILRGLREDRCPECGSAFSRDDETPRP